MSRLWRRLVSAGAATAVAFALAACAGPVVESGAAANPASANPAAAGDAPSAPSLPIGSGPEDAVPTTGVPSVAAPPAVTAAPVTAAPIDVVPLSGWDAVDRYIDITVVRGGSAAVSFAVMSDGAVDHVAAFGRRTADDPVDSVDIADRFRVASISKTITAITVLQLVEDGVVALDDPIGGIIAARVGIDAPVAGVGDITVRNLLTHRSGFGQYEDLFFAHQVESCDDAAVVGITRPLRARPGTSFQYSNLNFCVLGLVIEEVTGRPYEQVVDEQLLAPLGITGMRLAGTFDVGPGDVEHASDAGRNYMEVLDAAGAWIASPTDLVTILNSLNPATPGWKPLGAETLELMKTVTVDPTIVNPTVDPGADPAGDPAAAGDAESANGAPGAGTVPPAVPESGYGMGLMVFGRGSLGHTGTVESAHAMLVQRPDGVVWAITVSGDYPSSTRQLAHIMDNALLLGGFIDGGYQTVPPPPDGE